MLATLTHGPIETRRQKTSSQHEGNSATNKNHKWQFTFAACICGRANDPSAIVHSVLVWIFVLLIFHSFLPHIDSISVHASQMSDAIVHHGHDQWTSVCARVRARVGEYVDVDC